MSLYSCFRLRAVAERIPYLEAVKKAEPFLDVDDPITGWRMRCGRLRPWVSLPM
jgi:hypothetical protein